MVGSFRPGAVEPLVDAMAEALTADPATLERMGRAGAKRVAEQHNVYTEVKKLIELFSNRDRARTTQNLESTIPAPPPDVMAAS